MNKTDLIVTTSAGAIKGKSELTDRVPLISGVFPLEYVKTPLEAQDELVGNRSMTGKCFHMGGRRIFQRTGLGPIHYQEERNVGDWLDVDTVISSILGKFEMKKSLFNFETFDSGIGFIFDSRGPGNIEIDLVSISVNGVETQKENFSRTPILVKNRLRFSNVVPGIHIELELRAATIKVHKIIDFATFPVAFKWRSSERNMENIIHSTPGRAWDNLNFIDRPNERNRRRAEVLVSKPVSLGRISGADVFEITETFTGRTSKIINRNTRQKEWRVGETIFPIDGNQDITENIGANNDDGQEDEDTSIWTTNDPTYGDHYLDENRNLSPGYRFIGIAVGNSATINAGTQLVLQTTPYVSGIADGTLYADVGVTRQDAFSSTSAPSDFTNSSANVDIAFNTINATENVGIVTVMQELVDLAGWASGDNVRFGIRNDNVAYGGWIGIDDYDDTPATSAVLEINFTAAAPVAGGTTPTSPILAWF